MSSERVWYRFEGKREDGSVLKLRIQDLPAARLNDALDLITTFYVRDEAVHRSSGIAHNPKAIDRYRKQREQLINDPSSCVVICCSDDTTHVKNIMGLSIMMLTSISSTEKIASQLTRASEGTEELQPERKKLLEIFYEYMVTFNPITEFNLDVYYEDKGIIVDPDYRRLGIAEYFLSVRRIICEARGVPMTGAWMTAFGTQKAGAKVGWETVKEIEFDYLAKKHDVTFTNVPRTVKFMLTKVGSTGGTKKMIQLYEST